MELLLAFEKIGNLEMLAEHLAKDASVISRNLQKLASELPVLAKKNGRWRMTPLGRQINLLSLEYLEKFEKFATKRHHKTSLFKSIIPAHSLLIAINTQKALRDPAMGRRSNSEAEKNILRLLQHWRKGRRPIIHVKHVSENRASFFYRGSIGVDFISELEPKENELILEKSKSSAFTGTDLEKEIRRIKPEALVLVGFTGGECIDATARQASDLGYRIFVIDDATATFDIVGPNGKIHTANKVHKNTLATLHAHFAEVIETDSALV